MDFALIAAADFQRFESVASFEDSITVQRKEIARHAADRAFVFDQQDGFRAAVLSRPRTPVGTPGHPHARIQAREEDLENRSLAGFAEYRDVAFPLLHDAVNR